jgi:ATP-dependent exoDNAse (exonuclease V) alpha subunit
VLYVGDADQLPPVGSAVPHVFNIGKPTSILTTDHRFSSTSQMAEIVKILKENIQDKSYFLTQILSGKEITVLDEDAFQNKMFELYNSTHYQQDPYFVKSMAYRNKVVNNMNNHIRKYFYQTPNYQIGERLIVNKAFSRKNKMLANNGDVVTVIENISAVIAGIKCQKLTLENEKGDTYQAYNTTENSKKSTYRKKLVAAKKWKQLYDFMESFIEVKEPYSSTIHKAQGASYTNVLLHLEDLVACEDPTILARLLLVAVSRAREHVYVLGSVPINLMRKAS